MINKVVSIFAGGYLGVRLAEQLNAEKYQVKVSFRSNPPKKLVSGVTALKCYVEDGVVKGDTSLFECDVLVICIPPGFKKGLADSYPTNISALVEMAQKQQVKHIVFTSSVGIYTELAVNDENSQLELSHYKAKVLYDAEQSVLKSRVNFKHVLRLAGLMGLGRAPGRFRLTIDKENANNVVNMVMIDDVIDAIMKLIQTPNTANAVFNIVAPHHPSKQTFFRFARSQFDVLDSAIRSVPYGDSKQVDGHFIEQQTEFRYQHRNLFDAIIACQTE